MSKEEKLPEKTSISKPEKRRARTSFPYSDVQKMSTVISRAEPSEKTTRMKTKDVLLKLQKDFVSAHERGCSANDVYECFTQNGFELSRSTFFIFWQKCINNKKTKTKNKNGIKNLIEQTEKNSTSVLNSSSFQKESRLINNQAASNQEKNRFGFSKLSDSGENEVKPSTPAFQKIQNKGPDIEKLLNEPLDISKIPRRRDEEERKEQM